MKTVQLYNGCQLTHKLIMPFQPQQVFFPKQNWKMKKNVYSKFVIWNWW